MRFRLNEEVAQGWITELIMAHELSGLDGPGRHTSCLPDPVIGLDWRPGEPGQEDTVSRLLQEAHKQPQLFCRRPQTELAIDFIDDGDDWAYRYLLIIKVPRPLILASPSKRVAELADGACTGMAAALAVLGEAAQVADHLLEKLDAFAPGTDPRVPQQGLAGLLKEENGTPVADQEP